MKRTAYIYCSMLLAAASLSCIASCSLPNNGRGQKSLLDYVDTRVGTSPSITHTAGTFGKSTEEYGQTLPAVLEPNGMNFWTPQTRDTEQKCIAPYYYADTLLQGFRNSHWIVGGCTQDYGSCARSRKPVPPVFPIRKKRLLRHIIPFPCRMKAFRRK